MSAPEADSGAATTPRNWLLIGVALGSAALLFVVMLVVIVAVQEEEEPDCDVDVAQRGVNAVAAVVDPSSVPQGPVAGYGHEQLVNAAHIMAAGAELGLSLRDQQIGVMTAMGESSLKVLDYGDSAGPDSRGLFQQRANGAWGSLSDRMDPFISATNFFNALMRVPGREDLEPTIVAHQTQRNADPYHYERYWQPAVEVVAALAGTTSTAGAGSGSGTANVKAGTGAHTYSLGAVKPQLTALVNILGPMFDIASVGGYRASAVDPGGHPSGLAADFMVGLTPAGRKKGDALAAYAKANATALGIDYIIWYQRIWSASRAAEGWRPMADRGSPTANHLDHPHINVKPDVDAADVGSTLNTVNTDATTGESANCAHGAEIQAGVAYSVGTLNLLGAGHTDGGSGRQHRGFAGWATRLPKALDALKGAGVTVAGLQEVHGPQQHALANNDSWGVYPRSGKQNVVVWDPAIWTQTKARTIAIPYFGGSEVGMPLVQLTSQVDGQAIWILSIHNPANVAGPALVHRREALRRQAAALAPLAASGKPVFIVGDFNDGGDGQNRAHCMLTPLLTNPFGGSASPCRPPKADAPVDHILGANVEFAGTQIDRQIQQSKISDHPLVTASIAGAEGGGWVPPLEGDPPVTSDYGNRIHPITGKLSFHDGADYGASCGTPIRAAAAGIVTRAAADTIYGHQIEIDHGEIDGKKVLTRYGHMYANGVDVHAGDQVEAGQMIGTVGSDGAYTTGCHLHFTVVKGGETVDPVPWLKRSGAAA